MDNSLLEVIDDFKRMKVIVIGDAMLDSYLEGASNRLCREAPVPVVTLSARAHAPGGAANAAVNLATLGAQVSFLSVVGDDDDALVLRQELERRGVDAKHIVSEEGRHTLAKRRVVASGHLLLRFDEGDTQPISSAAEQQLIGCLTDLFPRADALLISDYGYGVMTPRIIKTIAELQARSPRVIVADAKDPSRYRHTGITAIKPNYEETTRLLGISRLCQTCDRAEQITAYRDDILDLTGAQMVAVTLDSEGALVFAREGEPYRTYATPHPDARAAGAGDTFVSALTLALAAGADVPETAELASAAASVVVRKDGTTACHAEELREEFSAGDKYMTVERLLTRLSGQHEQGQRIVFTNGCFDILHRGHVTYLNRAKALGDILVVGLNTDESVRKLKGDGRPINGLEDRVHVLAALSSVDYIVSFDEDTPVEVIRQIKPDIFVKGGDYTRDSLPEAPIVEELGGTVRILPYVDDRSTTRVIQRIREQEPAPATAMGNGHARH